MKMHPCPGADEHSDPLIGCVALLNWSCEFVTITPRRLVLVNVIALGPVTVPCDAGDPTSVQFTATVAPGWTLAMKRADPAAPAVAVAILVPAEFVNAQLASKRPPRSPVGESGEIEVPAGGVHVTDPPGTPRPPASTIRTRIESVVESAGDKSVSCVATSAVAGPTGNTGVVRNGATMTLLKLSAGRPRLSLPA